MCSSKSVHIIGGGIIGLCSAYYLNQLGYKTTVIDASDITDGTSFGNAGMIVPSHFIPLAAPGIISKGIRWMFDPKSPFYIKPRLNFELMQWLWKFYRSCHPKHVTDSIYLLKDYNELSKELYKNISKVLGDQVDFQERGLMMLCKTSKSLNEEQNVAALALKIGIQAEALNLSTIQAKNPDTQVNVLGGVWYPGDAQVYSNQFMRLLVNHLKTEGVLFKINSPVIDLNALNGNLTTIKLATGELIPTDQVVIAAGAWSGQLMNKLGHRMLLQDGRGYSITLPNAHSRPTIPSILSEAKVAMTPMGNDLRITGTLEISNLSKQVNSRRVQGFLEAVPQYFPTIQPDPRPAPEHIWTGYRPCSPDGIPYMGRSSKVRNLVVATGHAMMGMSLGPASGKLVAEIIDNKKSSLPLKQMDPWRF
jgi:D-amino-acid dehydrogenase